MSEIEAQLLQHALDVDSLEPRCHNGLGYLVHSYDAAWQRWANEYRYHAERLRIADFTDRCIELYVNPQQQIDYRVPYINAPRRSQ